MSNERVMLTTKIKRKISERERETHTHTQTNKQVSSFFEKNDERESNEKRLLLRIIISIIISRERALFCSRDIYAYIYVSPQKRNLYP
jgi:hypothetical protein